MKPMAAIIGLTLALTACGSNRPSTPSDPVERQHFNMGDNFGAVAFTCNGAVGLYVTKDDTRATSAIAAVANDPNCGQP